MFARPRAKGSQGEADSELLRRKLERRIHASPYQAPPGFGGDVVAASGAQPVLFSQTLASLLNLLRVSSLHCRETRQVPLALLHTPLIARLILSSHQTMRAALFYGDQVQIADRFSD